MFIMQLNKDNNIQALLLDSVPPQGSRLTTFGKYCTTHLTCRRCSVNAEIFYLFVFYVASKGSHRLGVPGNIFYLLLFLELQNAI